MPYTHHIGYFRVVVTKKLDRNDTREEVFILAHSFGSQLPYVLRYHGGENVWGGYSPIVVDSRSKEIGTKGPW